MDEVGRDPIGSRIHYDGHTFVAEPEMAEIFIKRATQIVEVDAAELVTLRHVGGIEMLLISRGIPLFVDEIIPEDGEDVAQLRERFGLEKR